MPKNKFQREYNIRQDKNQAILAPTTTTGIQLKQQPKPAEITYVNYLVMCPFCLHIGKIEQFLISTNKGYHRGLGKCPECQNQMQLRTLTAEWTPEQFAEFAYPYSASGYWQKVPFKKFNERLHKIGWSYRFWKRYKELKGEAAEEQETIEQKQEKMRYECQQCGEQNNPGAVFCKYCGFRLIESYG